MIYETYPSIPVVSEVTTDAYLIRKLALEQAIKSHAGLKSSNLIAVARSYEEYLKGNDNAN